MPINSKFISRKEYKEALLNFDSKKYNCVSKFTVVRYC